MMSCTTSAALSHPVSSRCYTEHGQRRGVVLSGCIITVAISRSGQLGQHCTVEPNCSCLSARLTGTLVTHEHALETCEASCVPRAAKHFFVLVVHNPLGVMGYVVAPKLSSRGDRAWSHGTSDDPEAVPIREAGAGATGTHGAPGAALSREVGAGATGTRGTPRATLSHEVGARAMGTRGAPGVALTQESGPWDTRACAPVLSFA
jgi:hypothetical protein